jgi:hypothetical protein
LMVNQYHPVTDLAGIAELVRAALTVRAGTAIGCRDH